jgi:hypothetical protein
LKKTFHACPTVSRGSNQLKIITVIIIKQITAAVFNFIPRSLVCHSLAGIIPCLTDERFSKLIGYHKTSGIANITFMRILKNETRDFYSTPGPWAGYVAMEFIA